MKKGIIAIVVAVVAVAFIADLFTSHGKKYTPATNSNNSSNSSSNGSTLTATDAVSIKDFAFAPASITVKKGTTVTWTNNDTAAHTVTVDSGSGPKSSDVQPGTTYKFTFDTIGVFSYHCAIHPSMTAKVTVTQ